MTDKFEEIFTNLARQYDPNQLFNEFLDYSIDINLMSLQDRGLNFQGREKHYFELFQEWVKLIHEELNNPKPHLSVHHGKGWYDYLGIFYESTIQSRYNAGNRGQFFTPSNVCETMVQITSMANDNDSPSNLITDCCCGSGRFLLSAHKHMPKSIMIGGDLDETACKMTVLNFYIHGVVGSVLHQNTLTGEFFGGWRVNKYLNYGFPIPHIELIVNEWEAYQFIGTNIEKKADLKEKNVVDLTVPKKTVQSKLW